VIRMTTRDCIFCGIIKGEVPSYKIWEDEKYVAILDIYPNIRGQCMVMPRRHVGSYVFALDEGGIAELMAATKKVARLLESRLHAGRVNLVFEGTGIDHLHAKLYPAIGLNREFEEVIAEEKVHFDGYPGYVTTLMGPRADGEELKKLQKEITGK
jgi:histidine triad (HIT) family protein